MREFLQGRINLVKSLIDSSLSVHYADLVLIICAVLSACASRRWKEEQRTDERRFIELLVYSPPDFHTSWVSVPSLLNADLINENQTPYRNQANTTRIFCDDEIDLSIEDAIKQYPQVPLKKLKQHCYACLIYERLRCKYSHEYWPGESIIHVPASRNDARISYIGRLSETTIKRMISFHLNYLMLLAEYHVYNLSRRASTAPSPWWIDEEY
jgi:hypothetical protein